MTTYTLENNVIRADGEYVCELIASDLQRLAAMMAALAQQPAQAVPDGWKLVPFHATREQVNAVFMHPDLARTLYRNMVEAAPDAPVAQEPVDADRLAASLAPLVTEWVEGGLSMGTDWRHGLACVIALRIRRLASSPAAEQPDSAMQALATISRMARNEACRSGAPAAGQLCTWDAIADMADAVTAEQPDTAKMRDLLKRYFDALDRFDREGPVSLVVAAAKEADALEKELRALLAGGEV